MLSSPAPVGAASVRINAGATSSLTDSNGNTWLADQYFTGGATYANSNSISGSSYPQVFGTERYGSGHSSFGYSIPIANGGYSVSLDFVETYVTGPGQRIFSVAINGAQVLTNFDIYAAAGGRNIAIQKTFPVTVTNGTLSINFIPGSIENPKINGIEAVLASTTPPPSPTSARVNAGATSAYTDPNGNTWLADQYFQGGAAYTNSNTVSGTSYPQIYRTERYGSGRSAFSYSIPMANGNYNVTLDFAETYVTGPGQRIFSIAVNGTQVLTSFDIYAAAGGMNIAVRKTFPVTVTSGRLSLSFIPGSVENPKINGIEVMQSSGSGSGGSSALQITTTQLPSGILTKSYNGTLTATGGTTPYSWSLGSGSLPNGLALSSSGSISGTPTSAGSFPFTVQVTDATAHTASSNLSITVANSNGSTASDCTLFASPSGNDSNSGASVSAPKTFSGAANATSPGSVVCLLGGTYNFSSSFTPPSSGTPSSWITYKSYGDSPVNIVYTGPADASPLFRLGSGSFPSGGVSYIEFRGLNLNGHGNSGDAFWCQGTHHLRFINNSMSDTGTAGIGTRDCDYLTADHNLINHNGYLPASTSTPQWYGWTSGISYNSNQWFDNYSGFHNIIANNIVVGEFDSSTNHTDGNGIILDLSNGSYNASTANTPPVLIINNVVYGNGGRCIHAYIVTNFYIVNNTCYDNNLDPTLGTAGSFSTNGSQNGYFINNISVAWSSLYPTYIQEGTNSNIQYFADLYFGSSPNFSNSQLFQADPLFVNPPSLTQYGYFSALPPLQLGNDLILQPGSPAYGKGIDPSTLSGLPSAILSDLKNYIYTDINGKARPPGGGSDPGAYQH